MARSHEKLTLVNYPDDSYQCHSISELPNKPGLSPEACKKKKRKPKAIQPTGGTHLHRQAHQVRWENVWRRHPHQKLLLLQVTHFPCPPNSPSSLCSPNLVLAWDGPSWGFTEQYDNHHLHNFSSQLWKIGRSVTFPKSSNQLQHTQQTDLHLTAINDLT